MKGQQRQERVEKDGRISKAHTAAGVCVQHHE